MAPVSNIIHECLYIMLICYKCVKWCKKVLSVLCCAQFCVLGLMMHFKLYHQHYITQLTSP